MFLRKKIINGQYYWSIVESYRTEGKVKQRTIESLGRTESAYKKLKSQKIYSEYYLAIVDFIKSDKDCSFPKDRLESKKANVEKIINGNSLYLSKMIDFTVDTCITSPPYYSQRDYGVSQTDWPSFEYSPIAGMPSIEIDEWTGCLGLEPTLDMYIGHLILIFREVWKVLKDEGSLWINLGDTYCSTAPNSFTTPLHISGLKKSSAGARAKYRPANPKGLKPKDMMGVPWRVAFALQAEGWYLRKDIIWNKPNCIPESVKDRPTSSHEYLFLLSKKRQYFYEKTAIAEESITGDNSKPRGSVGVIGNKNSGRRKQNINTKALKLKNKRSVWNISTKPTSNIHFATFPSELVENCLLATCPENGIVIDPFSGSGTVAKVAKMYQRGFVGVEIKNEYVELTHELLMY